MSQRVQEIDVSQVEGRGQETRAQQSSALVKPPSARKMKIYEQVTLDLRTQVDVAREFRVSQPRVSQIVAEVRQFFAQCFPDGGIEDWLAEAGRARHEEAEANERGKRHYHKAVEVWEQSKQPLVTTRTVYRGDPKDQDIVTVVVTEREQRLALGAVNTMERISRRLGEGSGFGVQGSGKRGQRGARNAERGAEDLQSQIPNPKSQIQNLTDELPAGIREEDREGWSLLNEREKAFARGGLQRRPQMPLAWAKLDPHSSEYAYFPWRSQREHHAANGAALVVCGTHTIEKHCQWMEHGELSNPHGFPCLLAKDAAGQWRVLTPDEVPRRAEPPERAAWPKESPQWIYWPYRSRAEHHAAVRARMVLDGLLSREQYERLNAWSRSHLGGAYFDPLAKIERNIRTSSSSSSSEAERGDCKIENANCQGQIGSLQFAVSSLQTSGDRGQETEDREQETEDREQETGDRGQETRAQLRDEDCKIENANCKGQIGSLQFAVSSLHLPGEAPAELDLAEQERQARRQLDYEFGLALRDEDIAEALAHQRRADRGQFVADAYNRSQIAALREWQRITRLRRRGTAGQASSGTRHGGLQNAN